MRSPQEDESSPSVPAWQSSDRPPKYADDASSNSSGSEAGDFMDRDVLEKDVRFQMEDRLEDGDEGLGFIDGSRKVCAHLLRVRCRPDQKWYLLRQDPALGVHEHSSSL